MAQRRDYNRTDRVSQELLEILSKLFLHEVRDQELQQIQLTAVEISNDFQVATVYYVMLADSPEPPKRVLRALDRAKGFLRCKLGDSLTMRHTPELRFKFDESVIRGRKIEEIISKIEIPPLDPNDLEEESFASWEEE